MITRDEKIDIYNWYKRTGNIALVADLFGKDRAIIHSIVRERQAYYRDRASQINAMPKVYLRFENIEDTSTRSSDIAELKVTELTKELLHRYHKEQTKKVVKSETKRKKVKSCKTAKAVKSKSNIKRPRRNKVVKEKENV